jgi:hypothetical protein
MYLAVTILALFSINTLFKPIVLFSAEASSCSRLVDGRENGNFDVSAENDVNAGQVVCWREYFLNLLIYTGIRNAGMLANLQ